MSYTAIEKMREKNLKKFGIDYPREPRDLRKKKNISNIERESLSFLRDTCEELRFDKEKAELTDNTGKSVKQGQIPYNMEMDIDRMCLENAIHRFMQSGVAQDAFDVYFCYLEMFIGNYGKSKRMLEMLAEFESNASSLLMKHRDHYSHSVYVFVIGLALYQKNVVLRDAYRNYYKLSDEKEAAHHYLKYWGLASLFHDIGYPFELSFEQVKSYFGDTIKGVPFVAYKGIQDYISLSDKETAELEMALKMTLETKTLNQVLAENIAQKLEKVYGESTNMLRTEVLDRKAAEPDNFSGFMDHAYFSAILLLRQLMDVIGAKCICVADVDAITAIALHNSMYKFSITNIKKEESNKPFDINLHPLAYILMLCDELQCWDRTSYGQNSRQELHAMWCDLEFDDNKIHAKYYFDKQQEYKKDIAKGTYRKMTDEKITFVKDIEDIIRINKEGAMQLTIETAFIKNNRITKTYLSNSSFLHLYNFATALNGRYSYGDDYMNKQDALEEDFEKLSLEYKLSNVLQAKAFSKYLNEIGCFYTDKPVAYELLETFSEAHMDVIGPLEHERWVKEKESMGWQYDTAYTDKDMLLSKGISQEDIKTVSKNLREQTRTHILMIEDYDELDKDEQDKDTAPMNCMLRLIEQYDGLRIYRIG